MALNTVPPVTLPPCIILSLTGFQIFAPGGGLNAGAVLPGRRIERSLVHRARRRSRPRVAVLSGRRGERKLRRARRGVVEIRIGAGSWLCRRILLPEGRDANRRAHDTANINFLMSCSLSS